KRIEELTDSFLQRASVRLVWKEPPKANLKFEAFNGSIEATNAVSARALLLTVRATSNSDPNTFDRSLVTVRNGKDVFTFAVDDLKKGALFLPQLGVAVLPESDTRDYAAVAASQKSSGARTLYDRVAEMPEQTWRA